MRRAAAPAKVGSWILSSELSSRGLCAIVPLAGHFAPEEGIDAAQGSQAFVIILLLQACAPLAQLDRASGYEPEGREFESLRARHLVPPSKLIGHSHNVALSQFRVYISLARCNGVEEATRGNSCIARSWFGFRLVGWPGDEGRRLWRPGGHHSWPGRRHYRGLAVWHVGHLAGW